MTGKYTNEAEIARLVRNFEGGTISREAWGHAEHLVVALHYVHRHDLETAIEKMRGGIFKLLASFGVDLTKEMPYHETLTLFWMRTIFVFAGSKEGAPLGEIAGELVEKFDKDYPLRFYTRELLFSERARAEYVGADLQEGEKARSN